MILKWSKSSDTSSDKADEKASQKAQSKSKAEKKAAKREKAKKSKTSTDQLTLTTPETLPEASNDAETDGAGETFKTGDFCPVDLTVDLPADLPKPASKSIETASTAEHNQKTDRSQTMTDTTDETTTFSTPRFKKPVFDVPNPRPNPRPATSSHDDSGWNAASVTKSANSGVDGQKLLVGSQINMSGEIKDCDTLLVEGSVNASTIESRLVEVAPGGVLKGDARVDEAMISGQFEGSMVVTGKLVITASGSVKGTIRYGTIEIETGGRLSGNVASLDDADADTTLETAMSISTETGKPSNSKKSQKG